jgi:hypothetical protein
MAPTQRLAGLPLEKGKHLCSTAIGPYYPSTCASIAFAWGSQKVISMARCQYSRCGQVSSEKLETAVEAGAEEGD